MCMDKPKINQEYNGKRIYSYEIAKYMVETYLEKEIHLESSKLLNIKPFLQKNYGGEGDCTLTSILTVVKYYKPELDENEVYNYIETIAKKYLYRENLGTLPIFNKEIVKNVFKYFNINKNVYSKYLKNIGFNMNTIITQLNNNIPVILSLTKDGRNFYENHTVTIIGYKIYKTSDGQKKVMFAIYDNWTQMVCYLDYQFLRTDCLICY